MSIRRAASWNAAFAEAVSLCSTAVRTRLTSVLTVTLMCRLRAVRRMVCRMRFFADA